MIRDRLGRIHTKLRISVTDRCNFRCRYCMPEEGLKWMERSELLSFEEIETVARLFVRLGIEAIRLTGGEPLLRKGLPDLVRRLAEIKGLRDLSLTTNGYFLKSEAGPLCDAGLQRITVSLDSLDPQKFARITRRDFYHQVWEGLEAVEGRVPVKINVVLMRGQNDDEIPQFAKLARTGRVVVRFIEFMPIGADDRWSREQVVPTEEVKERIESLGYRLHPIEESTPDPASRFRFADGQGEVGFISPVTQPFCNTCNRLRLSSDGRLKNCLFAQEETDLKRLIRSGADDDTVAWAIRKAVWVKGAGHRIGQPDFVRPERTISQIGG